MNAATSVLPSTERRNHQVPQPPQPTLPVQPLQKPAPAAIPDDRRTIQQPMHSEHEKGKGRLSTPHSTTEGKKAPPPLSATSSASSPPPKHNPRELIITPPVYGPVEKADSRDDYRHHTTYSYASDAEKQSYNGYGIPSEREYLTLSNRPDSICIGTGNGASETAGAQDRHMRRIIA